MIRTNIKNIEYYDPTILGSEGIISVTKEGIFKRFNPDMPIQVKKNKEQKLILLDDKNKIKKYYANPLIFVDSFYENYLTGYIMEFCNGCPLNEIYLLPEQKIEILNQLKKILIEFEQNGIIYEDIHFDNIFYDELNNTIKLIDIDNITIENYKKDTMSFLTKYYYSIGGIDNRKSRIHAFNMISYMLLYDCTSKYNIKYLRDNMKKIILNKSADELINNLLFNKINTSCDNEYLIDIIDEKILIK